MKKILRQLVESLVKIPHLRGRYRLVDTFGKWVAPEIILRKTINGVVIPLDQRLRASRYMYYGLYEEQNLKFLKSMIAPGDIVIEPGANIGYITAHLAGWVGPEGRVFALEPSPTCLNQLKKSIDDAGLPQITLLPMAIADKAGKMTFNDTPRAISRGYAALSVVSKPKDGIAAEVEVTSIDDLCMEYGIEQLRFLKLDIEGAELLALKGSEKMLSKGAINYVLVETTISESNVSYNQEMIDLLNSYHYVSHKVDFSGNLIPFEIDVRKSMREDIIWSYQGANS